MLSYYANELKLRTAYVSLTRGDGGQNLIGSEQGPLLGLIRTNELLEARKIDKAEQYFTRAVDFGYSKNPDETFRIWGKDEIMSDLVYLIRKFRPDVIINRFPTTGEGGHGHHTASAILGVEAFSAAADPNAFPGQLKQVSVWQSSRIFWNVFRPKEEDVKNKADVIPVDLGKYNPVLGISYGEMASESRSMHKSQGFGAAKSRGVQIDYLKLLAGNSFSKSELDGINTTWSRLNGSERIAALNAKIIAEFNHTNPSASIPDLLQLKKLIQSDIKDDYWREYKLNEAEQLILDCGGFYLEAISKDFSHVPGDSLHLKISFIHRSNLNVKLIGIHTGIFKADTTLNVSCGSNEKTDIDKSFITPSSMPYTCPFWLKEESEGGRFSIKDLNDRITAVKNSTQQVIFIFSIESDTIICPRDIIYKWVDPVRGELSRTLEVIPPLSITFTENSHIFRGQSSAPVTVILKANKSDLSGRIHLKLPEKWNANPPYANVNLSKKDDELRLIFEVSPDREIDSGIIIPEFVLKDKKYIHSVRRINYDHIPVQTIVTRSVTSAVRVDLKTVPLKVGYIVGAGDEIPQALEQAGFDVDILSDKTLSTGNLSVYDVIITGVRLYNTNERIAVYHPRLMEFVNEGGTLLVQYNTNNFLSSVKSDIGPYPFKITRNRVTDENSPVEFKDPGHVLLSFPNKISRIDFHSWVQERGIYFAGDTDDSYQHILLLNDPDESKLDGSLIYARHGKGHFIYTGLSFFRQLPAGVPGAWRLFVNLMSVGKS